MKGPRLEQGRCPYLFPHPARRRALLRTASHRYLFGSSAGGNSEKLATIPMYVGDLTLMAASLRFMALSRSRLVRSYSQPDLWVMI